MSTDRHPETPEQAVERRLNELLAEAPPLTPEQITAAVAILAQPKPAVSPARTRTRRRKATEPAGTSATEGRAA